MLRFGLIKFIKRCRLPTVGVEQACGLWREDAPRPIAPSRCYQGAWCPRERERGRCKEREREAGRQPSNYFTQMTRARDKRSQRPLGPLTSQPYEQLGRGPMEVRARGSGFSRGPAFQAPEQACCPSAVLQGLKKKSPWGSLGGSVVKTLPTGAGDTGSIPDAGRSHVQQSS